MPHGAKVEPSRDAGPADKETGSPMPRVVRVRPFLRPGLDLRSRRGTPRSGPVRWRCCSCCCLVDRIRRQLRSSSAGHGRDSACHTHGPRSAQYAPRWFGTSHLAA
jgi:hypothetical protein